MPCPRPALLAAMVLTATVAFLTGCTPAETPPASPSAVPPVPTKLAITVSDGSNERSFTVECDPVGGSHPHPESACEFLDLAARWGQDPFALTPNDRACAEVYGGPETATVKGTWRGNPVDAKFSRVNSCEIDRWNNAVALLAIRGQSGGS